MTYEVMTVVMKNCEPLVSLPALAIPSIISSAVVKLASVKEIYSLMRPFLECCIFHLSNSLPTEASTRKRVLP